MKKNVILLGALVGMALNASATLYTTNWTVNAVIPDNNPSGWTDTRTLSGMSGTLAGVAVDLQISSGWTGDLYAYLVHDSGFVVLLDRVGTPGLTYGYGAGSMNVTLADDGFNLNTITANIHGAGASASGFYNPDNNNAGLTSTAGSGGLASFVGENPNGTWSLFVADANGGGVSTVQSWGLQLDIVAVPEVEAWMAAALAGAFGAFWVNRQVWGRKRA